MPKLLDLYCGAGGSAVGYARAGFDVTGVDINPQPRYPFAFHQGDAMTFPLDGFDVVTASPPCQAHSTLASSGWVDLSTAPLLALTIKRFEQHGAPWIVENVASAPLPRSVPWVICLCGSMFGLAVRRHRLFAMSERLSALQCDHRAQGRPLGVYGYGGGQDTSKGRKASRAEAPAAMGIEWMNHAELVQAIPPAYTEWIGRRLLEQLGR